MSPLLAPVVMTGGKDSNYRRKSAESTIVIIDAIRKALGFGKGFWYACMTFDRLSGVPLLTRGKRTGAGNHATFILLPKCREGCDAHWHIGRWSDGIGVRCPACRGGVDTLLIDVSKPIVDRFNGDGVVIRGKDGERRVNVPATVDPAGEAPVDVLIVFVKAWATDAAMKLAAPVIGDRTQVLSLQNGWGNGERHRPPRSGGTGPARRHLS